MATQNYFLIQLIAEGGKKTSCQVQSSKPAGTMTAEQIKNALNQILNANALITYDTGGEELHFTGIDNVRYITSTKTTIIS